MVIKHKLSFDLQHAGSVQRIDAVQGDFNARVLEASLYVDGAPLELPGDTSAALRYCKSDGSVGIYDTLPDGAPAAAISGNVVTITLAPAMLAAAGSVLTQLRLAQGGKVVATFSFVVNVLADPSCGTTAVEDYMRLAIEGQAKKAAETAASVRQDADAGKFNGESAYEVAVRLGYTTKTEKEWAQEQANVLLYGPQAGSAAKLAVKSAEKASRDAQHINAIVPKVDEAAAECLNFSAAAAKSSAAASESASAAAADTKKTGEDRAAVEKASGDIQASITGVAQEPTAQQILEQQQKANKFLEQMDTGGLNGFSLKLGQDRTVILSYTDPVSGVEYSPATLPTESTAQQIIVERKKINKQLHLAAVAVEGDVE